MANPLTRSIIFPAVRYDHLSVLCELMPVALPSLAASLRTLSHGDFSTEALREVAERLGISSVEVEAIGRWGPAKFSWAALPCHSLFQYICVYVQSGLQLFHRRCAVPRKEAGWVGCGAQFTAEHGRHTTVWDRHVSYGLGSQMARL